VWDNEIEQMILVAFYHLEVLVSTIWFASMIRALWVLRWSGTTMHEYSQQRHKALNGVIFIQNVFMQIMFWKCLYYGFCGQGTVKIHCIYWHTKYRKTFSHNRRFCLYIITVARKRLAMSSLGPSGDSSCNYRRTISISGILPCPSSFTLLQDKTSCDTGRISQWGYEMRGWNLVQWSALP
jgi:hypothetical protein